MVNEQDVPDDLALAVVPLVGRLVETAEAWEPYRLLDAAGVTVEPVSEFFRELQAMGRSPATARSYGMDLLRWFRFLWATGVPWDRASTRARFWVVAPRSRSADSPGHSAPMRATGSCSTASR